MKNGKTKQATIPAITDDPTPKKIHVTKEYSQFKLIVGNRRIYPNQVANLTKEVVKDNRLSEFPILVTKEMFVIDGQHRLEVAKNNNLHIFYIITRGGDLTLVQSLNSSQQAWKGEDYLNSYIALGNPHYIKMKRYMESYKLGIHTMLMLVNTHMGSSNWGEFKRGQFKIENEEKLEQTITSYMRVRPYVSKQAWLDREFIHAFKKVLEDYAVEGFITKFEESNYTIDRQVATKDYLRELERVFNYRKQNIVRLF